MNNRYFTDWERYNATFYLKGTESDWEVPVISSDIYSHWKVVLHSESCRNLSVVFCFGTQKNKLLWRRVILRSPIPQRFQVFLFFLFFTNQSVTYTMKICFKGLQLLGTKICWAYKLVKLVGLQICRLWIHECHLLVQYSLFTENNSHTFTELLQALLHLSNVRDTLQSVRSTLSSDIRITCRQ